MPIGVRHCKFSPNCNDSTTEPRSFKLRPRSSNLCSDLGELVELIDAKRQELGLTQADLARLSNTDQPGICQMLSEVKKCSYERIKRVAEAIGLSLKIRVEVGAMPANVKTIRRLKLLSKKNREAVAKVTATNSEMDALRVR
ncbi:MAG: hypothetical protein COA78_05595 [Blastopirellula sp.]|nr:MAG: hypothetical protein COA78_05595 [Blastopirellula sp.]